MRVAGVEHHPRSMRFSAVLHTAVVGGVVGIVWGLPLTLTSRQRSSLG